MKKIILVTLCLMSINAFATTTYFSDGSSARSDNYGNTYFSDGTSARSDNFGNTYYSDGTSSRTSQY